MQLRYIDKKGFEKVKIVRNKYSDNPIMLDTKNLQNKSERYYFKEITTINNRKKIWFSKIDLNIENGKMQFPLVPTIRVAKPIIINNNFEGIVIINLFAQKFLEKIRNSMYFKIGILDKHKEYIQHYDDDSKNWSNFFKERNSFLNDICYL